MNKLYSNVSNPRDFVRKLNECLFSPVIKRTKNTSLIAFVLLFLLSVFGSINSTAQTVLINPAAEGGFELGTTFAANGWTVSNFVPVLPAIPNPWVIATLTNDPITGNAATVSSNGLTSSYSITSSCTNYFYRNVTVPAGQGKIKLDFNWLCGGESTWDMWQVFVAPTTITPVASLHPGSGASNVPAGIAGATFVGNGNLQAVAVQTATLFLPPSLAGTTFRLIFVWKSDTSAGVQPPAQIDNISLVSATPGNYVSITSGDWSAPSTWDIGSSPSLVDNVLINDGHTVTINAVNQGVNNLTLNGTLTYATAPTSFGVLGNLTIGDGGLVNVFEGTVGKTLTVSGNIVNNGVVDISVGTTTAGNLTLNGAAVQTVSGTGQFNFDVIRNLTFSNTNTAIPNINWLVDNVKIANNLNITGARINLASNNLTFGNNAAGGTLTAPIGSGFLPGGKFSRWWSATFIGTTITGGSSPTGTASSYPFLDATGLNRAMYITRTNATGATAGQLSVVYNNATSVTSDLDISDGTYSVTDRYNGNWVVSDEFSSISASSYRIALFAPNGLVVTNGNSRIIGANAAIGGVHQNGTAVPVAQRIDVPQADLLAGPIYLGVNADDIPYLSIVSGNWNADSTWSKGIAPSCGDPVAIGVGTTVTVNSAGNLSRSVTIVSGGSLVVASGDLTTGCTLNNNQFVNNGTFTVTGGTVNVNGNILNNAGSIINQSGGEIIVNGNDGVIVNSVPTGTPLFRATASAVANLNLTGGTIRIVNPHRGTSTVDAAFSISQAIAPNAANTDHTLIFGDGFSDITGGNTGGFYMNLFAGSQYYSVGNVIVDGGTALNRFLRTGGNIGIRGNLTVNSGEYQMSSSTFVAGNIVNNGTISSVGLLAMGTFVPPNLVAPSTVPQSISGTGVFRNSLTVPTANLTTFQVSNSSPSGLTLNVPLTVSGNLTLTSGFVNTTDANLLTLGTATAAGVLAGTPSVTTFVRGPFARTIASGNAATNYVVFPVGKSAFSPIALAPTTTEVSVVKAETFDTNTGTLGDGITNLSANRSWIASLVSGLFTNTRIQLGDATVTNVSIPVQAPSASGAYVGSFGSTATFTAGTPNVIQSDAAVMLANFTGFFSFAESNACSGAPTPGNTIASQSTLCTGQSVTLSLQNLTVGSGVSYQWKSSIDGVIYEAIVNATASSLTLTPTAAAFYLCDVTCSTGPATATSTAVQITFSNNMASTTPATRCGVGSVALAATGNPDATIRWYENATGGVALASGNLYNTLPINTTTSYYVAAEGNFAGSGNIGLGALTSSGAGISFLSGGWGGVKTQYIIRASELIAAGIAPGALTSLGFEPTSAGQTYTGFSVSLGATAQNAMTTAFISTGLSQVYLGTLANDGFLPVVNTVNTLAFGTGTGSASSFIWDGSSNIIVSISRSSVPLATNSTGSGMKYDATGFTSTAYDQADSLTPAAMLASATADAITSNRPRFIFNGQVICSSPRVAVVATVTPAPTFTLSATASTICSGSPSTAITIATGASDFDTFVWSPAAGVSGDSTTGWTFNTEVNTTFTLTASQATGGLCAATVTVAISVNPIPTPITFVAGPSAVCLDQTQSLSINGGTLGASGIIGVGVLANTNSTPFKGFWGGSKTQALYTAAELTTLGLTSGQSISTIGYVAIAGTPLVLNNFSINAGFVSASTLGTTFSAGATTVVLASTAYTPTTGIGNLDFPLSIPLVWDGVSSLLLETCFNNNNGGGSSANSISVQSSAVASGLNILFTADNNATVCSSATTTSSTSRPNLRIIAQQTTAITWSPVTNLFTDAAATVAYTAGTSATTVYFKSSTVGTINYTVTATSTLDCSITSSIAVNAVDCSIPYANLQFPGVATIGTCVSPTYYARVYKAGVTEAPGQGLGIQAWIGKNTTNTDPATWLEASWQLATFNVQSGNDDEYQATLDPSAAGTYYVASRFAFATGSFVYGGYAPSGGGIWDGTSNVSGVLTVETILAPTASAQTFCNSGTVADLVATGTTLQWYADATGGTALAGTTALVTGDYYVSQTLNSCESARTMVDVTVTAVSAPTGVALQDFIAGQTLADFTVSGTNIVWYTAATGGTVLPSTTVLVSGTIYYASQTIGTCESETRLAVTAGVDLRTSEFEIANLRYYPNPVQNILTIDYSQTIEGVQMFNMLGQMVYNKIEDNSKVTIDMTNMAAGSYILEVKVNGITKNVKVIKN